MKQLHLLFMFLIVGNNFIFGAQNSTINVDQLDLKKLEFTSDESYGFKGKMFPNNKCLNEYQTFDNLKNYFVEHIKLGKKNTLFPADIFKFVTEVDLQSNESKCIQRFISLGCTKVAILYARDALIHHPGFSELGYLFLFYLPLTNKEIHYILTGQILEGETRNIDEKRDRQVLEEYKKEMTSIANKIHEKMIKMEQPAIKSKL